MTSEEAQLLAPTLFFILLSVIVLNTIVFFGYYLYDKKNLLSKRLFLYWVIQLVAFLSTPLFGESHLQMSIPFSFSIFNLYFLYRAMFADYEEVPSYKRFLYAYFFAAWPLTIILEMVFGDFTITTMPIAIGLAAPVIYMFKLVWFDAQKRFRSSPHILMSLGFLAGAVHCINFSLFRDDPSAIIWGTTVHILIVILYGIGISNFYNYMLHKNENARLAILVDEKTAELNNRLVQVEKLKERNESLFRLVLHDISNPMSAILGYLTLLKNLRANLSSEQKTRYVDRAMVASESVASTIRQVRLLASDDEEDSDNYNDRICLREAFETAQTIFEPLYQRKKIELDIQTPAEDVCVKGNKELFIHTVLGNLLSNSLKFTEAGKLVQLKHEVSGDEVKVIVIDQGHGIKEELIERMFDFESSTSTKGTQGEVGNGFGMPLLKKYVKQNKGAVEVSSILKTQQPEGHGTSISVSFPAES